MKVPIWKQGMTPEQGKDIAYQERNLLALYIANYQNYMAKALSASNPKTVAGWYYDADHKDDPSWAGWLRVISLDGGKLTFHIPDDFDIGNTLPQIEPNWNGHTTEQKWKYVMSFCDCQPPEEMFEFELGSSVTSSLLAKDAVMAASQDWHEYLEMVRKNQFAYDPLNNGQTFQQYIEAKFREMVGARTTWEVNNKNKDIWSYYGFCLALSELIQEGRRKK